MNDEATPTWAHPADEPLDAADIALLADVATLHDERDPVPGDLVERVKFALALDEVFDEVARISRVPVDAAEVRSDLTDAVFTSTLTFSTEQLTAMISVTRAGPGRVRLDGWVSPAGERRVGIRMQTTALETHTDDAGRFVVDDLREGFAQLVFHPGTHEQAGRVATPLFKLSPAD